MAEFRIIIRASLVAEAKPGLSERARDAAAAVIESARIALRDVGIKLEDEGIIGIYRVDRAEGDK